MKHASEFAGRLKKFLHTLPRAEARPHAPEPEVTGDLILAILRKHASDSTAHAGYKRLREATVDLNDLRVTPAADIAEILGSHFPEAPQAGESIARALVAIFNRCHHLDLGFLKNQGKNQAREYVESLDGVSRFSSALFCMRTLGQHAVPVDERGLEWLKQNDLVDASATEAEAQSFLEKNMPPAQVEALILAMRTPAAKKAGSTKEKKAEPPEKPAKKSPDAPSESTKRSTRGSRKSTERPRRPVSRRK